MNYRAQNMKKLSNLKKKIRRVHLFILLGSLQTGLRY